MRARHLRAVGELVSIFEIATGREDYNNRFVVLRILILNCGVELVHTRMSGWLVAAIAGWSRWVWYFQEPRR